MQGAVHNQWLTCDRINTKILGNASILPHANSGLINAFAFCHTDIDRSDLATVCQAMSQRMHSENIQWSGNYRFPTFD